MASNNQNIKDSVRLLHDTTWLDTTLLIGRTDQPALIPIINVGTKGVSQIYHLSFDDNKVLKIINWIC